MTTSTTFVLPGDPLPALTDLLSQTESSISTSSNDPQTKQSKKKPLRLGAGLLLSPHTPQKPIQPYRAGELRINPRKPAASIESIPRRYQPHPPDPVLVTLLRTTADSFIVQLTPFTPPCTIPFTSYSLTSGTSAASSRKTRPNLLPGCLIYCVVTTVHKHLESPELSVPEGENWGEIKNGFVVDISTRMVRVLLDEEGEGKVLLNALGEKTGFEMIVGRNGRCWIDAKDARDVWRVVRCIRMFDDGMMWDSDNEEGEVKEMVRGVFSS